MHAVEARVFQCVSLGELAFESPLLWTWMCYSSMDLRQSLLDIQQHLSSNHTDGDRTHTAPQKTEIITLAVHVCVPQWGAHCCKEAYSNLDRQLQSIPVEYYMQAVKELDKREKT